jgi:hypothetical protein
MLKRSLAFLPDCQLRAPQFCGSARKFHQPKPTPQNSSTTQGLIAVSPVNSRVVWASGRRSKIELLDVIPLDRSTAARRSSALVDRSRHLPSPPISFDFRSSNRAIWPFNFLSSRLMHASSVFACRSFR